MSELAQLPLLCACTLLQLNTLYSDFLQASKAMLSRLECRTQHAHQNCAPLHTNPTHQSQISMLRSWQTSWRLPSSPCHKQVQGQTLLNTSQIMPDTQAGMDISSMQALFPRR